MRVRWTLVVGLAGLLACNVPGAPAWTADYVFPLDYPSVDLSGFPGGVIPSGTVTFDTPVETQDVVGLVEQVLTDSALNALTAEVITDATVDVTGSVVVSIATNPANLFSATNSVTVTVPFSQTADTTTAPINVDLLRTGGTLYFQSRVTVSGGASGTPVGSGSEIGIGLNLFANVQVSQ
jgi:hypothetical protein